MPIYDRKTSRCTDPATWTLADFNEVDELPDEYRESRFHKATNTMPGNGVPDDTLRRLLADAATELAILTDPAVDRSDPAVIRRYADLYCFLGNAQRMVPLVTAWVVVKVYNPNESFRPGQVAEWVACTTQEQADVICAAMPDIYPSSVRGGDTWEVRRMDTSVTNMVRPDATERYLTVLRRSAR